MAEVLIFKGPYLGNYWAYSAQPMHGNLSRTFLSEKNQMDKISILEKIFLPKIAKNRCLGPPGYNYFGKIFFALCTSSIPLLGSMNIFLGLLVFKGYFNFQKSYVRRFSFSAQLLLILILTLDITSF